MAGWLFSLNNFIIPGAVSSAENTELLTSPLNNFITRPQGKSITPKIALGLRIVTSVRGGFLMSAAQPMPPSAIMERGLRHAVDL